MTPKTSSEERRKVAMKNLTANLQAAAYGIEYARKMNYSGVDIEEAHNRLDELANSVAHLYAAVVNLTEVQK